MFNKNPKVSDMSHIILRRSQVKARTGMSRSSIYNAVKEGTFPRQVKLGLRAVGWVEASIDSWIQSRVDRSDKLGA
jgi:prophage regulatory protein